MMKTNEIARRTVRPVMFGAAWFAGALLASVASASDVVLPADGTTMNRLHLQFRWEMLQPGPGPYRLEIVEDDGSADPFVGGFTPERRTVSRAESRTVVKEGLEFGRSYAWRASALIQTAPSAFPNSRSLRRRIYTPVRRFDTIPIVFDDNDNTTVPELELVVPPVGGLVEPGIVMWAVVRAGSDQGQVLAVDESGKLILRLLSKTASAFGDTRMLENGRLLWNDRSPRSFGGLPFSCRTAIVGTLDGNVTWQSLTNYCDDAPPQGITNLGVHHEAFALPADAPRGANFLLLEYDNRELDYVDIHDGTVYDDLNWQGDVVKEIDRHTKAVVKQWSTFDGISLDDHLPRDHDSGVGGAGGDWNHANAVIYDPVHDRVWMSLREQSRLVGIDWSATPPVSTIHFGDDSIITSMLYSGPYPGGDVDFGDNLFSFQHAPELLENGHMLIYNNGNYIEPFNPGGVFNRRTTVIEVAFDDPAAPTSASLVAEHVLLQEDQVTEAYAPFVGDGDRQPGGNTLTVDGPRANIMELDPGGNVVWFLDAGEPFGPPAGGVLIYRVEKVPELIVDTPGDTDGDWDLDLADLAEMQVAFTGSGATPGFPDSLNDHDGDGDIDHADVDRFAYWMTGPGR